jgi:GNAT superfamily N-acetyltransferase
MLIKKLASAEDWSNAFEVIKVLRPNLESSAFLDCRERLINEGYNLIAVTLEDKVVSIASYIICPHPVYYRELQIHDMATLHSEQGKGHGSELLAYIKQEAINNKCGRIFVHSRLERKDAHRFYNKNGFGDYSLGLIAKVK